MFLIHAWLCLHGVAEPITTKALGANLNYHVQFAAELPAANWTLLETIAGDGTEKAVTHADPPGGMLFYRVESELP